MNILRFTTITFLFGLVLMAVMFFQWGKIYIIDVFALFWLICNIFLQQKFIARFNYVPHALGFCIVNILFVVYFLTTTESVTKPVFKSYTRFFEVTGQHSPKGLSLNFLIVSLLALFLAVIVELGVMFFSFKAYRKELALV